MVVGFLFFYFFKDPRSYFIILFLITFVVFVFETGSHCNSGWPSTHLIAQAGFKLEVIPPQLPECWQLHHSSYLNTNSIPSLKSSLAPVALMSVLYLQDVCEATVCYTLR